MFVEKYESRIKQMGRVSFSVLTGLRESIDLVFGIITMCFKKVKGRQHLYLL